MKKLIVIAALLACPVAASAMTRLDVIATTPASFNGAHVDVRGVVSDIEEHTAGAVHYEVFLLCSSACVRVVAMGWPNLFEGQSTIVHGVFSSVARIKGVTFYNAIQADDESL